MPIVLKAIMLMFSNLWGKHKFFPSKLWKTQPLWFYQTFYTNILKFLSGSFYLSSFGYPKMWSCVALQKIFCTVIYSLNNCRHKQCNTNFFHRKKKLLKRHCVFWHYFGIASVMVCPFLKIVFTQSKTDKKSREYTLCVTLCPIVW